jgi:hypothetical protein
MEKPKYFYVYDEVLTRYFYIDETNNRIRGRSCSNNSLYDLDKGSKKIYYDYELSRLLREQYSLVHSYIIDHYKYILNDLAKVRAGEECFIEDLYDTLSAMMPLLKFYVQFEKAFNILTTEKNNV